DYQGTVDFQNGRLVIRVLHIDDFITTECDSASGTQAAFEELVDDYIATCVELKKEPSKPFKGSFNVRLSPELHKRAAMTAAERDETLNTFVVNAIEHYIEASSAQALKWNAAFVEHVFDMTHSERPTSPMWQVIATSHRAMSDEIEKRYRTPDSIRQLLEAKPNMPWVSMERGDS
ncbi:MAG TPA: type II toxin-antitoxin system HicB family antitoxin, partial [Xanthobacteraceae bacterium]|nr:type II toxin-antitoxin system HicB family antitoxin [Xanthobacteraceae bacterium]